MSDETPTDIAPILPPRSIFVPAALLALAVASWSGFQTWQLVTEQQNLQTAIDNQTAQVESSDKLRASLQKLAVRLAEVAQGGNANATVVVDELRRRGITINPAEPLTGQ